MNKSKMIFDKTEYREEVIERMADLQEWCKEREIPFLAVVSTRGIKLAKNLENHSFSFGMYGGDKLPSAMQLIASVHASNTMRHYMINKMNDDLLFRCIVQDEIWKHYGGQKEDKDEQRRED